MERTQSRYLRRIYTLLLIISIAILIYLANGILFPLILAFILAILIRPVDAFFQNKLRIPKAISIILTLLIAISVFASIFFILGMQLKDFVKDLPHIEKNISNVIRQLEDWITDKFGVSYDEQQRIVQENIRKINFISMKSFGSVTSALMYFVLVPIYMFLFLFYRSLLLTFLLKLVSGKDEIKMQVVVNDIKMIVRKYIIGLLIEIAVVATLTSVGLWLIGVRYALFLGLLTALLNLIPYVGILVANVISCLLALSGSDNIEIVIGVLGVMAAVQLIDNNLLLPRIVGSNVRINALASILSVIVGGTLAGVPGMFLAIPITAIIKVVFDALPQFESYGYLLGDEVPTKISWPKMK